MKHPKWATKIPPDAHGPGGSAWRIFNWTPQTKDQEASIAGWIVHAPHAHPFWQYYLVDVIHLRRIEGQEHDVTRAHDDMTHQFTIMSLSPDDEPPSPDGFREPLYYLEPFDVDTQFHVPSDEASLWVGEGAVRVITAGLLSPDSDYRERWNISIAETAAHERGEHEQH